MNIVIVPVDFSPASETAAEYTAKLFNGHAGVEIVLYHLSKTEVEEITVTDKLEKLRTELSNERQLNISILHESGSDFIEELEKLCRHRNASMVVMGVNEQSAIASLFTSVNALKIADCKACPVLVIPPGAVFSQMENVMLTSDFKDVHSTTPSVQIKNVLEMFTPKLHIVNVDSELYVSLSEGHEAEKAKLKEMFAGFNPEFYFLRMYDVDEAIKLFAADKNIDLIINIHREHSLLHKLFAGSHTKNLIYSGSTPVLSVHE